MYLDMYVCGHENAGKTTAVASLCDYLLDRGDNPPVSIDMSEGILGQMQKVSGHEVPDPTEPGRERAVICWENPARRLDITCMAGAELLNKNNGLCTDSFVRPFVRDRRKVLVAVFNLFTSDDLAVTAYPDAVAVLQQELKLSLPAAADLAAEAMFHRQRHEMVALNVDYAQVLANLPAGAQLIAHPEELDPARWFTLQPDDGGVTVRMLQEAASTIVQKNKPRRALLQTALRRLKDSAITVFSHSDLIDFMPCVRRHLDISHRMERTFLGPDCRIGQKVLSPSVKVELRDLLPGNEGKETEEKKEKDSKEEKMISRIRPKRFLDKGPRELFAELESRLKASTRSARSWLPFWTKRAS